MPCHYDDFYCYFLSVTKSKEREQSPSGGQATKEQKTPQGTAKGGKAKGKEKADKADKSKAGGAASRPASVTFDVGKPHWTLRVVSDAPAAVRITLYPISNILLVESVCLQCLTLNALKPHHMYYNNHKPPSVFLSQTYHNNSSSLLFALLLLPIACLTILQI